MELNTRLTQEKDNPQELGPDIYRVTEKSAYPYKCCSFVVMSTLPDCSEDLPFDFRVLKFQNGNQQTSNNEHELEQHPLSEVKRSWLLLRICLRNVTKCL